MKKQAAPNQNALHQNLLLRIREASFPADFDEFDWQELEDAGLLRGFVNQGLDTKTFRHFVLLATQAKELRKQRDWLARRIELLEHYDSPLWDAVWNEPCPIEEAKLRREAEADDIRNNEQHRKQRDPLARFMEISGKVKVREWEFRDKRRRHRSFRPALWHEPMSIMDHREATGLSRRTIQNMLDRIGARPIAARKRRNEPARYKPHTNHALLCDWLSRCVKDRQTRRGWLARTLAHCLHETPKHYARLFKSMHPVLASLDIQTLGQRRQFARYIKRRKETLYPSPPNCLAVSNFPLGLTDFTPTPQ